MCRNDEGSEPASARKDIKKRCQSKIFFIDNSSIVGLILYEYHTVLLLLGKLNLSKTAAAKDDLRKSLDYMKESLEILKDEPQHTFAGQLYLGVNASAKDVEAFIRSILK